MLLNTEIKIIVTNDGKENKVSVSANKDLTVQDILTSVKLGENTLKKAIIDYVSNKGTLTEKEVNELLTTTLQDIYGS